MMSMVRDVLGLKSWRGSPKLFDWNLCNILLLRALSTLSVKLGSGAADHGHAQLVQHFRSFDCSCSAESWSRKLESPCTPCFVFFCATPGPEAIVADALDRDTYSSIAKQLTTKKGLHSASLPDESVHFFKQLRPFLNPRSSRFVSSGYV